MDYSQTHMQRMTHVLSSKLISRDKFKLLRLQSTISSVKRYIQEQTVTC